MPELNFDIVGAEVPPFAAVPTLAFKLRVANTTTQQHISAVALRCQIQLTVTQRHYSPAEQRRLLDIFGEPKRWRDTLRSLLWTHVTTMVPQFTESIIVDLPVLCTYDFEVVSTKYLDALEDGDIPLTFLFSGTIFYQNEGGHVQIGQISWSKEASYRMPIKVWQAMIQCYYPNSAWIRLHKDIFDQLYQYKATQGLPTWEEVVTRLLQANDEEVQL